jgi:hypothetical protein
LPKDDLIVGICAIPLYLLAIILLSTPKELRESTPIQLPVVREKIPTTIHKDNVQDLFSNIF